MPRSGAGNGKKGNEALQFRILAIASIVDASRALRFLGNGLAFLQAKVRDWGNGVCEETDRRSRQNQSNVCRARVFSADCEARCTFPDI